MENYRLIVLFLIVSCIESQIISCAEPQTIPADDLDVKVDKKENDATSDVYLHEFDVVINDSTKSEIIFETTTIDTPQDKNNVDYKEETEAIDNSPYHQVSFIYISDGTQCRPYIEDLNNDGYPEVIVDDFGDEEWEGPWGAIEILTYDPDGFLKEVLQKDVYRYEYEHPSFPGSHLFAHVLPKLGIGDINGDGIKEIIKAEEDAPVPWFIFDWTGTEYQLPNLPKEFVGPYYFAVDDVNNDSKTELIALSIFQGGESENWWGPRLYALEGNGAVLSGFPIEAGSGASGIKLADFDKDGQKEIAFSDNVYEFDSFTGYFTCIGRKIVILRANGQSYNTIIVSDDPSSWVTFETGDVYGNELPEIVVFNSFLYSADKGDFQMISVYDPNTGENIASWQPEKELSTRGLIDVEGDGKLEIAYTTYDDREVVLSIVDYKGNALPGWPLVLPRTEASPFSAPIAGDLNKDDINEVVVGYSEAYDSYYDQDKESFVLVLNTSGEVLHKIQIFDGIKKSIYPQVTDINNNGKPDLVIGAFRGWIGCELMVFEFNPDVKW